MMNNEIMKILEIKEDCDYKRLSIDEIKCLEDYITNLQEELEEEKRIEEKSLETINNLQEEIERQSKAQIILANQITEMYDYKSRCEKAVEYINKNQLYNFDYDKEELFEIVSDRIAKDYLLHILQGDDKNE